MTFAKIAIPVIAVVIISIVFYAVSTTTKMPQSGESVNQRQSTYIKEFSLPDGTAPNAILPDGDTVWVVGTNSMLVKFDTKKESVSNIYQIGQKPESFMSWAILKDNDGFLWFSRLGESKLWRFDPVSEKFQSFATSAPVFSMKLDKKTGHIWFVTLEGGMVGILQKTSTNYSISEFEIGVNVTASSLFVENDHVLVSELVSENGRGKISEFSITRDKDVVTNITRTGEIPYRVYDPTDIFVLGNTVWFTEHGSGLVASFEKDSKNIRRFPTSDNQFHSATLPLWLRQTDGSGFWFNEHGGNRVGFFDITINKITEYEIPSRPPGGIVVYPLNIAVDSHNPDKAWFSEWNTDKIAVVDRSEPIPFDLEAAPEQITQNGTINIKVTNNAKKDQVLFVNATAPDFDDGFIRTSFSQNVIKFKDTDDHISIKLAVEHSILAQNLTITASVTDGMVTRSTFVEVIK
jgi:streptogramin lyase